MDETGEFTELPADQSQDRSKDILTEHINLENATSEPVSPGASALVEATPSVSSESTVVNNADEALDKENVDSSQVRYPKRRTRLSIAPELPSKRKKRESIQTLPEGKRLKLASESLTQPVALSVESANTVSTPMEPIPNVHFVLDSLARVGESMHYHSGRITAQAFKNYCSVPGLQASQPVNSKSVQSTASVPPPAGKPILFKRSRGRPRKIITPPVETTPDPHGPTSSHCSAHMKHADRNVLAVVAPETLWHCLGQENEFYIRHPFLHNWERDEDRVGGGQWRGRRDAYLRVLEVAKPNLDLEGDATDNPDLDDNIRSARKRLARKEFSPNGEFADEGQRHRLLSLYSLEPLVAGFRWNEQGDRETLLFWR